ncbi:hypothetical protein [Clostridium lundense]|uniref:hypothetical protein n=1 Tax=Clostridium lundense TaxID=319475 RepID=UPI000483916F|nr:hypothetical protein [Clostridium lundense]
MNEEVSDASAYMWAGGRESFIGAVSGAIFGPFGTLKTLGGKMLFGGVTNGFESMVRQTLDGQGINFTTTLFDVGIGAATAGMFHKVEKVFKKASPWVKKGASKVNDAIENAVNKFKNMSDNFSSRFGNKLAFEGIGGFNGNSPINNVKLKPTRTQIAYNEAIKETKEAAENQMKKATSKGVGEATVPKRPGGYRYI